MKELIAAVHKVLAYFLFFSCFSFAIASSFFRTPSLETSASISDRKIQKES